VAAVFPADLLDLTPSGAMEEKKKLQKHFARFDILFFLLCTLVGLDTIGSVAAKGAQGFTWIVILAVVFFVPYALLTAELGTAFPEEGGSYIWTRLAFGRPIAAVNAVIYWMSNPIWLGGLLSITALTTAETFFNGGAKLPGPMIGPDAGWFSLGEVVFVLAFIWISVWSAILSFNVGKWVPTIGAIVRISVLGLFVVTVAIYALEHGIQGFGISGDDGFLPTTPSVWWLGFIGLVPVLFFNYVGFELPSAAGEEMKDAQRDVPFSVFRSAIGTVLLYGLPIVAILLVLPKDRITGLSGFISAIQEVFTVYGGSVGSDGTVTLTGLGQLLGWVAAIAFILGLFTSGTTWIMGADRSQAMAALDGAAPPILGRISSRWGTPIAVNLMSGILATIVMLAAFALANGNNAKYFTVVLGLTISTTDISYLAIFPALYLLRRSHPHVPRAYKVPGGNRGALLVSGITFFFAAFATIVLLYPGFLTSSPDASLPTGGTPPAPLFDRSTYELTQIIPLLVIIGIGVAFYILGAPTRRRMVQVPLEAEMGVEARR
jgi:amino acid transporter